MLTRIAQSLTAVCLALQLTSFAAAQTAPLPVTDDFSDGDPWDGEPVTWTGGASIVNQDLRMSGLSSSLVAGSQEFRDVSIRTTARATVSSFGSPSFHFLGPVARSAGANLYWGGITTDRRIGVGTWQPYSDSGLILTGLDPTTMDIDLQFDVVGNRLSLWAWSDLAGIPKPNGPQVTWQSNVALNSGSIGLSYNDNGGSGFVDYRYFTVIPFGSGFGWNVDADGDWSRAANWNIPVPNSTNAEAYFGAVTTAPRTVAADVPITVGRIRFDSPNSYTIAGPSAITLDVASGTAAINVDRGGHVISAPVTLADNTTVTLSAANSNLLFAGGLSGPGALLKVGPGSMTASSIRSPRLSVNEGVVTLRENGGVSVLGALSLASTPTAPPKFDLTNNATIIDYTGPSPETTIRDQILAGRGGSGLGKAWDGNGITSSTAAIANATQPESRSVGFAENSSLPLGRYTSFRGQSVDDTSILMAYTRTGDANLDGLVNDDDVTIVGATYAPGVPQPHWALGDFDYNGFVDDDDVTLLGAFYDPAAAPLISAAPLGATAVAAVPEPSTWLLAILGLVAVIAAIRRGG